jgi:hypothetical protein
MSKVYRGRPSIDASYQVLVHLAKLFQRRRSSSCEQYQLLVTVNRDILIVHTLAIFCCSPTMRWSFNRLVDEFTPYREEEDLLL